MDSIKLLSSLLLSLEWLPLMPDAESVEEFWQNIIDAHVSIKEVPKERWDPDIYWENGAPGNVTEGKTYSKNRCLCRRL